MPRARAEVWTVLRLQGFGGTEGQRTLESRGPRSCREFRGLRGGLGDCPVLLLRVLVVAKDRKPIHP